MTDGARTSAASVAAALKGHEDVCAERYLAIHNEIAAIERGNSELRKILGWCAAMILATMLSVIGWGITQQFAADRAGRSAEQAQIGLLHSQMATIAASLKPGGPTNVTVNPAAAPLQDATPNP